MPKWTRHRQANPAVTEASAILVGPEVEAWENTSEAIVESGSELLSSVVDAATPVISSIASGLEAALSQFTFCGSTGDFQSAMEYITLSAKFQDITSTYPEKIGSPCMQSLVINTLSGFFQCERPVFRSSTATTVEEEAVEAFMAAGMFYE